MRTPAEQKGIGNTSRREFLAAGAAALAAGGTLSANRVGAAFAYVGCFTTAQRYARGLGIQVYRVDPESGTFDHVQLLGDLVNPSFLAMRRDQRFLYSVHGDEGYATSFSVDPASGRLAVLNRASTGGRNGVHLAVDPAGRFLVVANYATGSVSVMPIRDDGRLSDAAHVAPLPGQPGPHRVEQASSHPHQILFDPSGRFVVAPDKGLDRIFVFRFDSGSGTLTPTAQGSCVTRTGSGPRHACFHPTLPVLWVLNEIHSSVATYYWDAERGHIRPMQIVPLLPPDYTGENTSAAIAVSANGRFVYCSNRGHDSVAILAADPNTGLLTPVAWDSSRGRTPRFIGFGPGSQVLLVANEQSDTVVAFHAEPETGRLSPRGHALRTPSPVTIAFARWNGV
jgi:6-phosphogluconolactonase (cycloisomerase 2 family)